jgi:hypothetical protein
MGLFRMQPHSDLFYYQVTLTPPVSEELLVLRANVVSPVRLTETFWAT